MNGLTSIVDTETRWAARFLLEGGVQGIGVRPAIARLAEELGLSGFAANRLEGVAIHVEGAPVAIDAFERRLATALPQPTDMHAATRSAATVLDLHGFEIQTADATGATATPVPRDRVVCRQCLDEIADAADRRAEYAFTSCTDCGPRYSLIDSMPYERALTSMRGFELCPACRGEFESSADRRFHAQTNACPACGPTFRCDDAVGRDAIAAAAAVLRDGGIVALKGVGGYQLVCDATNSNAVRTLRERKRRRTKPLPIMVEATGLPDPFRSALDDSANPIVLLPAESFYDLAGEVHPGLNTVGVMSPTTPLHWLLLRACECPLVVTSGNVEGEPLAFENADAAASLRGVCERILHHDRPIVRPIDDSVVRIIGGHTVTIRAARGIAPLPLNLATEQSVLAVGGHQKVAVAFSNGRQSVLGPHVGDLGSLAARERFVNQTASLIELYGREPDVIVHDMHPDYFTTRWAAEQRKPTIAVQHHHAHVVAGMLERGWLDRAVFGVAFDGTGFGTDGTIWGGEFLRATSVEFERVGHLRRFVLPGGETAIRQPWRIALSLLVESAGQKTAVEVLNDRVERRSLEMLASLVERGKAGPVTTSAGRLFDGIAALLLPLSDVSFEGEPAMRLEAVCDTSAAGAYAFPVLHTEDGLELDWRQLMVQIVVDIQNGVDAAAIAMRFHRAVAQGIVEAADQFDDLSVVLSGGCFQNKLLTELVHERLAAERREVALPGMIPPNDGGLAAGQLAIGAAQLAAGPEKRKGPVCA